MIYVGTTRRHITSRSNWTRSSFKGNLIFNDQNKTKDFCLLKEKPENSLYNSGRQVPFTIKLAIAIQSSSNASKAHVLA